MKQFDLNIETILENWETKHAIREIIANALDESNLSQSRQIEVSKDNRNRWYIRDYGRGLRYEHFTQNENEDKLTSQGMIGKFGVGLKDALATFERNNIKLSIQSKYCSISIAKSAKKGFENLSTLHANIFDPISTSFVGTEFSFENLEDKDVESAKDMFLHFKQNTPLEKTVYGEIISSGNQGGSIYINGMLIAIEENFLFSYNITQINS